MRLRVDPDLLAGWPGPEPLGLGSAAGGVVVVTAEPVSPAVLREARERLAGVLGVPEVDLVAASGETLLDVLRDWVFQAAQGSGRGVHVRLEDGAGGRLRVLLDSWDSSAREVVLRLSSPHDPALAALGSVLPGGVDLVDAS